MPSPITPKDLERVTPRFHGSFCDEMAKLGQFDILVKSFMEYVTDGCIFTENFKSELCGDECTTTTSTTTVCLFGEATTTTTTTTCGSVPDVPVLAAISTCNHDLITVNQDATPGATSWEIYRSEDGGAFSLLDTYVAEAYQDFAVTPGVLYAYKVKACNSCGCSDFSNTVSCTPSASP